MKITNEPSFDIGDKVWVVREQIDPWDERYHVYSVGYATVINIEIFERSARYNHSEREQYVYYHVRPVHSLSDTTHRYNQRCVFRTERGALKEVQCLSS